MFRSLRIRFRSLRIRALCVTFTTVVALTGAVRAEKLHWIDGGPNPQIHTLDLALVSGPITSQAIANLEIDERVVGMCLPPPPMFPVLYGQITADLLLFTEDPFTLEHRRRGFNLSTVGAFNAKVINDGSNSYEGAGMQLQSSGIPFVSYPNGTTGKIEYHVIIDKYGSFYRPGTPTAPTIYIGAPLATTDEVIATTKSPGGRILVMTRGSTTKLHSVQYSAAPGIPLVLKTMNTFPVTYPLGYYGSSVVAIAMAPNKQVYALVNRFNGAWPKSWGDTILCRGTTTNGKLDLAFVRTISNFGTAGLAQAAGTTMVVR